MEATLDIQELETKVKDMYRHVAEQPQGKYHFELGRPLAKRLGYPADVLDRIPEGAIESFAGVGYFFDLAYLEEGQRGGDTGEHGAAIVVYALLAGQHQVHRPFCLDGFGQCGGGRKEVAADNAGRVDEGGCAHTHGQRIGRIIHFSSQLLHTRCNVMTNIRMVI